MQRHGNGLREFSFEIPAGWIAGVGEQGVYADGGLPGLKLVEGVFSFAAFFSDGEDAERGDGFEGIVGFGIHHAYADGNVISGV